MRYILIFFLIFAFIFKSLASPFDVVYDISCGRTSNYETNTDGTWSATIDGVQYQGISVWSSQSGANLEQQNKIDTTDGLNCWCKITSPFDGRYVHFKDYTNSGTKKWCNCGSDSYASNISYITCNEIINLYNALLNSKKIPHLYTSNGTSFTLHEEKTTTPALHVRYEDKIYYGNLESGRGTNTINILNQDGSIWHLVE